MFKGALQLSYALRSEMPNIVKKVCGTGGNEV